MNQTITALLAAQFIPDDTKDVVIIGITKILFLCHYNFVVNPKYADVLLFA